MTTRLEKLGIQSTNKVLIFRIANFKVLGTLKNGLEIVQAEYQSPSMMVANRDFLFARGIKREQDGTIYVASVRAELKCAGWKIIKVKDEWEITYINHVNFNGWVPNWVVSTGINDQPACIGRIYGLQK
jgi:hypothetical protein